MEIEPAITFSISAHLSNSDIKIQYKNDQFQSKEGNVLIDLRCRYHLSLYRPTRNIK